MDAMLACIAELQGKGRALIASRDIKAGETVLLEEPAILLVDEEFAATNCAICLKSAAHLGGCVKCECGEVFCSPQCAEKAVQTPHLHSQNICRALRCLDKSGLDSEDAVSLRLLVHVLAATLITQEDQETSTRSEAQRLCSLLKDLCSTSPPHLEAAELHRRLVAAVGPTSVTAADVDSILRKEASNSYGIMAPPGEHGERVLKGSGLFPMASLLNHDCLPNTARFDSFDTETAAGTPGQTTLTVRALHDIPKGEELTTSYFPMTLTYHERQQRCREQYGFECSCLRCQEEANWKESESEMESGSEYDMHCDHGDVHHEPEATPDHSEEMSSAGKVDEAYIFVFLTKYVCRQEGCEGTLAPILGSSMYECNRCGCRSTEEDFLACLAETTD